MFEIEVVSNFQNVTTITNSNWNTSAYNHYARESFTIVHNSCLFCLHYRTLVVSACTFGTHFVPTRSRGAGAIINVVGTVAYLYQPIITRQWFILQVGTNGNIFERYLLIGSDNNIDLEGYSTNKVSKEWVVTCLPIG